MRIRILLHSIKESFHNVFGHPLLTLASITTMTLMLTLLGAFTLFSTNVNQLVYRISQQPPVEVFLRPGVDAETIQKVEAIVSTQKGTLDYMTYTSEENFEKFRASMGEQGSSLDYFDTSLIPASIIVRLKSPEEIDSFRAIISGIPEVDKIDYSQTIADTLITLKGYVNLAIIAIFIVLAIMAFFIISNMVRISVFSRGSEIQIMKYIGATNAYIRIPYILEGAIIGLMGAAISWGLLYFLYVALYDKLMQSTPLDSPYALIDVMTLVPQVVAVTGGLGVLIGMIGSSLSVRRHVKV